MSIYGYIYESEKKYNGFKLLCFVCDAYTKGTHIYVTIMKKGIDSLTDFFIFILVLFFKSVIFPI